MLGLRGGAAVLRFPFVHRTCVDEAHLDHHRREGRPLQLPVVPDAPGTGRDGARTSRVGSAPRRRRNGAAVPAPVGIPRSSIVDEPGAGTAWERTAPVLPGR